MRPLLLCKFLLCGVIVTDPLFPSAGFEDMKSHQRLRDLPEISSSVESLEPLLKFAKRDPNLVTHLEQFYKTHPDRKHRGTLLQFDILRHREYDPITSLRYVFKAWYLLRHPIGELIRAQVITGILSECGRALVRLKVSEKYNGEITEIIRKRSPVARDFSYEYVRSMVLVEEER